MPISKVKTGSISDSAVTSAKIQDGSIVNADINACAAIASSKLTVDTSALESDININKFNISLLGFKMAVNEGLTVFNLVDGVVDEFNDESGTDEAEGSNDNYCASSDFYANQSPVGGSVPAVSAGFSMTAITEPDTSTTGTNPGYGTGTMGSFTVPCAVSSVTAFVWGAGGGRAPQASVCSPTNAKGGGGGGFVTGNLAVTGGQTLHILAGEGNAVGGSNSPPAFMGGGANLGPDPTPSPNKGAGGGGVAGVFAASASAPTCLTAPQVYFVAGSGGGASNDNAGVVEEEQQVMLLIILALLVLLQQMLMQS
jgi:hypothetical protein